MLQDLRFAARLLAKDRWFSAVAITALALGTGVTATVFTLVNAVLIRAEPFKDSGNVYMLSWQTKHGGRNLSYADLNDWREQTSVFTGLGGWMNSNMSISDDRGLPEEAHGTYVTANAFSVVGQQPLLGRDFGSDDERHGADLAVIIGYRIWKARYGGDFHVIGTLTRVNGQPAVIVGVMPEHMQFPQSSDVWAVLVPTESQEGRISPFLNVFGRLRNGVTRIQAEAETRTIAARRISQYPQDYQEISGAALQTFNERFKGGSIFAVFLSMMGAVGFVLLIACANVANLLLARSAHRAREVAVRMAIGATRWRIVRQLLIESIVLGLIGGALGLLLAVVGVRAFDAAVADTGKPSWIIFTMDFTVFGFLAGVCLLTAVLFGIAPALHVSRTNVSGMLKESGRGSAGGRRMRWLTSTMVVVETALTVVLLVGAGLMIRSFMKLQSIDTGIRTERLVAMQLQLSGDRYQTPEARRVFYETLQPRLAAIPGTEGIAITTSVPPFGSDRRRFEVDGRSGSAVDAAAAVSVVSIGPSFFDVAGVSILRGRSFTEADGAPGSENVIIDARMAAKHFEGENPIGKRIRFGQESEGHPGPLLWRTIVGVSPTIRHSSPQEAVPPPVVYTPYRQDVPGYASIMVRSALPPATIMDSVRREVQIVDSDQPVFNLRTIDQMLDRAMWPYRVFGSLFAVFALIGVVLSAVGLYAVTAYAVTQRTQEIGVRMALGAQGHQVTWMILRRGLIQLALGLSIGLGIAYFLSAALQTLVVQVTPTDPTTFVGMTLVLSVIAIAACLIPARRALRVEPLVALRAGR